MVLRDVIVITMNYRLGAMGLMSLGNRCVSGNMALKDMTMGLKWIQENIEYFGGDANRVTIFGESAGMTIQKAHAQLPKPLIFIRISICDCYDGVSNGKRTFPGWHCSISIHNYHKSFPKEQCF